MKTCWLYLILIGLLFQGCDDDDFCNCFENKGSDITETRMLNDFNTLDMDNNVDIILTPDSTNYVEVTCGKNLMDGIRTEVSDGILKIKNVNRCNWLRDFKNKFTANIHFKSLQQINNYGSGNLTCADTLRPEYLMVDVKTGSGQLSFLLNGGEIYLKLHTGPGDIIASGKAGVLYLYSAGNGFLKTAGLESEFVYLTTKSTGDCEVFAKYELGVEILYNGDVYYKGAPPSIIPTITGSGKLIPF